MAGKPWAIPQITAQMGKPKLHACVGHAPSELAKIVSVHIAWSFNRGHEGKRLSPSSCQIAGINQHCVPSPRIPGWLSHTPDYGSGCSIGGYNNARSGTINL